MTRINVGIEPHELPNRLLLAEHREITRIPNAVAGGRINLEGLPEQFTLGTGHVRFFYCRLRYLARRYRTLLRECKRRGFAVTDKSSAFRQRFPVGCWKTYAPTLRDRKLVLERIHSKGFQLNRGEPKL